MKLTEHRLRKLIREEIDGIFNPKHIKKFEGVPESIIIVQYPQEGDELGDIVFEVNWEALPQQFKGMEKSSKDPTRNIFGIYHPRKKSVAIQDANDLLRGIKK